MKNQNLWQKLSSFKSILTLQLSSGNGVFSQEQFTNLKLSFKKRVWCCCTLRGDIFLCMIKNWYIEISFQYLNLTPSQSPPTPTPVIVKFFFTFTYFKIYIHTIPIVLFTKIIYLTLTLKKSYWGPEINQNNYDFITNCNIRWFYECFFTLYHPTSINMITQSFTFRIK